MGYCVVADLERMINKIPVSSGLDKQGFIDKAQTIMDSKFAGLYDIPIAIPSSVTSIQSGATANLLKSINEDLAAGHLLLTTNLVAENVNLHKYSSSLVFRALDMLKEIKTQEITLVGAPIDSNLADNLAKPKKIHYTAPDGKSDYKEDSDKAVDDKSYFNRPYEEIGDEGYEVDINI